MGDLTKDFSSSEFICPCGCGLSNISMELVNILQLARYDTDRRMDITSGSRCPSKNSDVGGSEDSLHLTGQAADIYTADNLYRHALVTSLFSHGIKRVYIYKRHIHVDIKLVPLQVLGWGA